MGKPTETMGVQPEIRAVVATYTATIAHKLLASQMSMQGGVRAIEIALAETTYPVVTRPSDISGGEDAIALDWLYHAMERRLAVGHPVRSPDIDALRSWLHNHFSMFESESQASSCKVFRCTVELIEGGGIGWQFHHPEMGDFPVSLADDNKEKSVRNYLISIIRLDLLNLAKAIE